MSFGINKAKPAKGGKIKGAGTGTSDDVKKTVPSGSYIMPADSTQQLGARNLKNLGKPSTTEVNVSNGEYLAAPDQLQAIGGLVLDRLKNATHTPVDQPQLGFKPGQNKPELFFANGTSASGVPDLLKRRDQNPMMNNGIKDTLNNGFGKSTLGSPQTTQAEKYAPPSFTESVVEDIGNDVGNEWKQGNYARSMGQGVRGILSLPGAAAYDALKPVGNFFGGLFNTDTSTPTSPTTPAKQPEPAQKAVEKAATNTAPSPTSTPNTQNSTTQPSTNTQSQDMFAVNQGGIQQQAQANPYAIQQKGNAFSYADPGAAAQARANGVPELQGSGVQRGAGINGIKDFMAKTPEMNLGMQGYGNIERQPQPQPQAPQRTPEQEAERQRIMKAASTPYAGAQRGQLTAAQLRVQADMNQGDANRENDVYKTDANNAANIEQTGMREAGQTGRTALEQQAANWRTGAGLDLESQKFNATNDLANRQFSAEQLNNMPARMKQAYELNILKQYEAAKTPEERQSLAEKLGMVRGQQSERGGSRVMAINGGETIDEKGNIIKNPDILINNQTGQRLDGGANQTQQNTPQVGTVINGYKYKGGDFNKPESWEKA